MHHVDAHRLTGGAVALGLLLLLAASPALADGPPPDEARLEYERPAGLASCPEEVYFHHFVAVRFAGIDPFTPTAPRRITVKIHRGKPAFVATLAMYDENGKRMGGDELVEPTCQGVVESAGRRVASWLIPIVGPAHEPAGAPPPAPAPPAPSPRPVEPQAPAESPKPSPPAPVVASAASPGALAGPRFVPRVVVGAQADFGGTWGALFGVALEGGVQRQEWRRGGWSLMGGFRWDPQQPGIGLPSPGPTVNVTTSLVAGSLTGCVHRAWTVSLAGCVVADLGAAQQSAGTPAFPSLHQTVLFGGGGGAVHVDAPLVGRFYVDVATDVVGVAKLAGGTNEWNNVTARRFGGAAGRLGAGVGASF